MAQNSKEKFVWVMMVKV